MSHSKYSNVSNDSNANWRRRDVAIATGSNLFNDEHNETFSSDPITSSFQLSSSTTSSSSKNYPSFTIILRRKLKTSAMANLDPMNEQPNNGMQITDVDNGIKMNSETLCHVQQQQQQQQSINPENIGSTTSTIKSESNVDIDLLDDFEFSSSWQLWLLNVNNNEHLDENDNNWNVSKYGLGTKSAKKFWTLYMDVYEMFKSKECTMKSIMIFRDHIEPKWEHHCNVGGGRWYFDVSYQQNNSNHQHKYSDYLIKTNQWTQCMQLIMARCLGQPWDDMIVGIVILFKTHKIRISFWVKTTTDFNQIIQLGSQLQKYLQLRLQIKYEFHNATNDKNNVNGNITTNNRLTD